MKQGKPYLEISNYSILVSLHVQSTSHNIIKNIYILSFFSFREFFYRAPNVSHGQQVELHRHCDTAYSSVQESYKNVPPKKLQTIPELTNTQKLDKRPHSLTRSLFSIYTLSLSLSLYQALTCRRSPGYLPRRRGLLALHHLPFVPAMACLPTHDG
jgi:hypothetical protein